MDYHIYKIAKKKVKEKRKFYSHLLTWGIMSVFFILLNLFTTNVFWAIFPILGWGIGLAFHGIKVFSINYGDEWEEREIQKEMDKLRQRETYYLDNRDVDFLANNREKRVKNKQRLPDSDFV